MTLDEMIAWLEAESAKRLAAAGRRDGAAAYSQEMALRTSGRTSDWYKARAAHKVAQGVKLREEAATLLAIENALRAVRESERAMLNESRKMLAENAEYIEELKEKYGDKLLHRAKWGRD